MLACLVYGRGIWWIADTVTISSTIAHIFAISLPFGIFFGLMLVYFGYLLITSWKSIKEHSGQ